MKKARLYLVVFVLGLVICELIARVGLYCLEKYKNLPYEPVYSHQILPEQEKIVLDLLQKKNRYYTFDSELGWSIAENASVDGYRSNSLGARSNIEYSPTPKSTKLRIATFGDSFVHCDEVANEFTWQYQLEAIDKNLEVLNFGVGGYAPDQAYLRYIKKGAQTKSDVVIIGMMTENINRIVTRFRGYYNPNSSLFLTKPRFVFNSNHELVLLENPLKSIEDYKKLIAEDGGIFEKIGENDFYYENNYHYHRFDEIGLLKLFRILWFQLERKTVKRGNEIFLNGRYNTSSDAFKILTAVLSRFEDHVKENHSIPIVVLFPQRLDLENYISSKTKRHQSLLDYLDSEEIQYLDLTEGLSEVALRTGVDALFDGHYSELGNEEVAKLLYPHLKRIPIHHH